MGGDQPSTQETTRDMLQALAQYAPDAIAAISATTPGTARQALAVQQETAPGYAELQNRITAQYGPEAARIGSEIERANQLAAAQTEADILTGPGQSLVSGARAAQEELDPEFYANRAMVSDAINKYLSSYSPTELTEGEIEQINRGISAREGPVTPSALRTIRNAQTFGDATTKRWQNFGDAVIKASSALPGLKSGLPGFEIATRRPLISNVGESRLSSPAALDASQAFNTNFGFANTALNQIGNLANTRLAKRKDILDQVVQGSQAFGNVVGSFTGG